MNPQNIEKPLAAKASAKTRFGALPVDELPAAPAWVG